MSPQKLFSSRNFLIFNVALSSMLVGAFMTMLVFSCTTAVRPAQSALAQDRPPLAVEDLAGVQSSFRTVAEYILPTVVEIRVSIDPDSEATSTSPFREYFFGPDNEDSDPITPPGLGSGFVIARGGRSAYVVTNAHVAANAQSITIVTFDGAEYPAEVIGNDPRRDLAVLAFDSGSEAVPTAPLGDSDDLYVGDWVLAVGNPFGFASSVTAGIVSAKERLGPADNISDFIQTDAAINRGNSGGPLVNLKGEVIGINTWITTPTGVNVGLGFAIPINNVKQAVDDIIANGEVEYGWLGVEVEDVSRVASEQLGYGSTDGAIVSQVFDGSPAHRGDMRPGDIVVSIDGIPIRDYLHLVRLVGDKRPEDTTEFLLFRDGDLTNAKVTIGRRMSDAEIELANRRMWPGIAVIPLSDSLRATLNIPERTDGLFINEVKHSAAPQSVGIRHGDVLLSVNGVQTKNLLDFYQLVNDTDNREFELTILRSGEELSFTIRRG